MQGVCVDAEERMAGYRTGGTSVLSWEEEAEKGWSERWEGTWRGCQLKTCKWPKMKAREYSPETLRKTTE